MCAGALATILVWSLKQWAGVDVPAQISDAFIVLVTVAGAHFVNDSPPPQVAREAVSDASDAADAQASSNKRNAG